MVKILGLEDKHRLDLKLKEWLNYSLKTYQCGIKTGFQPYSCRRANWAQESEAMSCSSSPQGCWLTKWSPLQSRINLARKQPVPRDTKVTSCRLQPATWHNSGVWQLPSVPEPLSEGPVLLRPASAHFWSLSDQRGRSAGCCSPCQFDVWLVRWTPGCLLQWWSFLLHFALTAHSTDHHHPRWRSVSHWTCRPAPNLFSP